jgi:hypothetical protein
LFSTTVTEVPESYQPVSPAIVGAVMPFSEPVGSSSVSRYCVTVVAVIEWGASIELVENAENVLAVASSVGLPPSNVKEAVLEPVPADLP